MAITIAEIMEGAADIPQLLQPIPVFDLASDSRMVKPGTLYFALSGSQSDGHEYIAESLSKGAIGVVGQQPASGFEPGVPYIQVADSRWALAKAAARFFSEQPATMVAVTGTAGKTSVASFVHQLWRLEGRASAMIGTTGVDAPGFHSYGNLTTPDSITLHKLLAELSSHNIQHCSMEASSHGLEQSRLAGADLAAGAFTNLGHDHLDYHHNLEEYFAAKMLLFRTHLKPGAPAIYFADDAYGQRVGDVIKAQGLEGLSVGRSGSFITLKRVEHLISSQNVEIEFRGKHYRIEFPLAGDFQIANGIVAAALAIATGSNPEDVFGGMEKLKGASGRLELVGYNACFAPIYVDYAHKPEALETVLKTVRPFTEGQLWLVFGCGGDRDPSKRPIMGEIANRLADHVIVTDDNPRTEDAGAIRAAIMDAVVKGEEIADRYCAIKSAVKQMKRGDCLVVAGKGHEQGQIVGKKILPFSDHDAVKNAIDECAPDHGEAM